MKSSIKSYKIKKQWENKWTPLIEQIKNIYNKSMIQDKAIIQKRRKQITLNTLNIAVIFSVFYLTFLFSDHALYQYYQNHNTIYAERFYEEYSMLVISLRIFMTIFLGALASFIITVAIFDNINKIINQSIQNREKEILKSHEGNVLSTDFSFFEETVSLFEILSQNKKLIDIIEKLQKNNTDSTIDSETFKVTLKNIKNQTWSVHDLYIFYAGIKDIDLEDDGTFQEEFLKTIQEPYE